MHTSLQVWVLKAAAIVAPFLLWAVLAIAARKYPTLLHKIYPALMGCSIIAGFTLAVLALETIFEISYLNLPLSVALLFGIACQPLRIWVQRRVAPESLKPQHDGPWPAKRKS
jgi:NO-binding membrane sensor protein with MHYT domain